MSWYRTTSRIAKLHTLILRLKKEKYSPQKAWDIAYEMRAILDQLIYQIEDWGKSKARKKK